MNQDYLNEVFQRLEEAGWAPEWCDVAVPLIGNTVQAGLPTEVGDMFYDECVMVPRSLARCGMTFCIIVRGDSMVDCGIQEGDILSVQVTEGDCGVREGDIVVAEVDGGITVKTFFRDAQGEVWLLPRNDKYMPIHLTEDMNARIMGKVLEFRRKSPHTSMAEMMSVMKRNVHQEDTLPSAHVVKSTIVKVAERITNGRLWFAVYRALVDRKVVEEGDYPAFIELIEQTLPNHPHLPRVDQLRRMCVQSFRKHLSLWRKEDAPVQGSRYDDYFNIAREAMKLL